MSDKSENAEFVIPDKPLNGKKAATEQDIYLFALAFAGEFLLNWAKDDLKRYNEAHPEFTGVKKDNRFESAIDERTRFFDGRIKDFCHIKGVRTIDLYVVADKIAKRMEEMEDDAMNNKTEQNNRDKGK